MRGMGGNLGAHFGFSHKNTMSQLTVDRIDTDDSFDPKLPYYHKIKFLNEDDNELLYREFLNETKEPKNKGNPFSMFNSKVVVHVTAPVEKEETKYARFKALCYHEGIVNEVSLML